MNQREKYIYNVYLEKSFSKAAEKLFVSQPALSAIVKKHEKTLGYEIFDRKTSPITLTRKGEIYIDYLREKFALDEHLLQRLNSFGETSSKTIAIGGSNSASAIVIPKLCKEYHKRYPDINIKIDVGEIGTLNSLLDNLDNDILDIVVTANVSSPNHGSLVLWEEKYMILSRRDYPGIEKLMDYSLSEEELTTGIYSPDKEIKDLKLLGDITIFKPGQNRKVAKIFPELFAQSIPPQFKIVNFRKMDMQYSLMLEGLGAVMLPRSSILEKGYDSKKLCCFVPYSPDNQRQAMLVYKNTPHMPKHIQDFIDTAKDVFTENQSV